MNQNHLSALELLGLLDSENQPLFYEVELRGDDLIIDIPSCTVYLSWN